ncbi:hypothetical protein [Flavobacterium pallidum]|uniref:hypothetical protein n=1 Tax=Flavobacterium pallidum TaxID=2172098 RepID=UPI0015E8099E|nr:hypothetical protein [Flavobacterium pallidum]
MKRYSSILLLLFGTLLIPVAMYTENIYLRYSLLFTSIIISVIAVIKSFIDRKNDKK